MQDIFEYKIHRVTSSNEHLATTLRIHCQGWRKQFPIGQAKIQIGMSAWVALEHTSQENSCPEILAEI